MDIDPGRPVGYRCGLDILQAHGTGADEDDLVTEFIGMDQQVLYLSLPDLLH